jgi:predicted nucleic acid-binding protein
MRCFFDTNILVYLFDGGNAQKRDRALAVYREAVLHEAVVLSAQVLNEFFVVSRRNPIKAMSVESAGRAVRDFSRFPVIALDGELTLKGIERMKTSQISFWDSLIVEAALRAKAQVLYSEDLQHGMVFDTLQVINPFAA